MIMSVLLKCAREEKHAAWMWRLSRASLKDGGKIAQEETSFLQHFICLGRTRYTASREVRIWGSGGVLWRPPCLTKSPRPWFLWDSHQGYCGSPGSFQVHPGALGVVPCWMISPRCSGTMSSTAPCGSLLLKLQPRPLLLILLLGRTCLVGSAVGICGFLLTTALRAGVGL